ncbi:GNAT family N-acetyltransferase [Microbacterium sp. A93]|uniref:GNAT family N-acetyltransferase n=1 Tax=Microbacterium sp. A93 TaxID=3450716 RepID=UPI003F422F1D
MRTAWLRLPDALDQARLPMPPATADFLQVAQLANLVTSLFWGTNDFYVSPEHQLAGATARGEVRSYVVAREPLGTEGADRIVGYATLSLPVEPGGTEAGGTESGAEQHAEVWVGVHPDFRRRGVGSALLREAEAEAARRGCSVLRSWTDNALLDPAAVGSGPVFVTGTSLQTGLIPAVRTGDQAEPDAGPVAVRWEAPDAAFAATHGYGLAQVEWTSVLDLREAAGAALRAESGSTSVAEHGYELVGWERADDDRGVSIVTTAVRDPATGQLVGHTDIETSADLPQTAYQGSTPVHPDHRGRGLVLLLKAVNISRLLELKPETERLYTWNDAEHQEILRANDELGFVPAATRPGWRKSI